LNFVYRDALHGKSKLIYNGNLSHVPSSPRDLDAVCAGNPALAPSALSMGRNKLPRNVFETSAEENVPRPAMCRIVSALVAAAAGSVATLVYPV